ncbi:hypothetical protein G5S35_08155 [Paraburkholderia tropica]|uniref:hypothetical protein n=1 Tax=Paraburkholderia tropica TaxID=92647 RepID=UPI001603D926|nr:hypothetical protein [Paraburkholderia tropica]QNB11554.1 hypothetical protein G5S35_08155 [Paraburkholderia tropica]
MDYPQDESVGLVNGKFVDENETTAQVGSLIPASWANSLTDELINVIEAGGLIPAEGTLTQLLTALQALFAKLTGDVANVFSVAPATKAEHAMQLQQAVGRFLNVQPFGASGTYKPTAGTTKVIVEVQGGGGGSGGAPATGAGGFSGSAGGSSGSYAKVLLTAAQIGASQTVTIGAAGAAGASGAGFGGTGGTSSFGALVSCPGGPGSSSYGPTASTVAISNAPSNAVAPTISAGTTIDSNQGNLGTYAIGSTAGGVATAQGGTSPMDGSSTGPGHGAQGTALGASQAAIVGNAAAGGKVIIWEYA